MNCYLLSAFVVFFSLGAPLLAQTQGLTTIDSASIWPRRAYVVLNDSAFSTHHIQAQSKRESFYTHEIETVNLEIFNIITPIDDVVTQHASSPEFSFIKGDTLLISFSALPDSSGAVAWQSVVLDSIPAARMRSLADVVREGKRRIVAYRQAGNPKDCLFTTQINLYPVIRRQNRYWVPKQNVLTEYFLVRTRATSSLTQTDYVTINIKGPLVSSTAPWRTIRALLPSNPHYEFSRALGIVHENILNGVYSFWYRTEGNSHGDSFTYKNNIYSSNLRELGLGSFKYKPGIGIVGGEYPSYFNISNPRVPFNKISIDGFSSHKSD